MDTSILKTKISVPSARPQLVPRNILLETLQHCTDVELTLISAPAGFGKTTLINQWAHNQPGASVAWFSIDTSDDDPVRYWRYVLGALQALPAVALGIAELPLLSSEAGAQAEVESFVTLLINSLATIERDFVLVLDDYHHVSSPIINASMTFLIEHLPPAMHIIIATREDPPFPLAGYRGKGKLLAVTAEDLRFDLEDASRLLRACLAPPVSADELHALLQHTEGWAVGLKMVAQSLKGRHDTSEFIRSFTGSQAYIMDYLMEEVLQNQPEETTRFLLKTSILEALTGPLCDALTSDSDGDERLADLERANLFIVPLDETHEWYRYEHLFADLLRHQCEKVLGKETVTDLHRLASRWYQDNGRTDEAVHHALGAGDWEFAMELIENRCEELRKQAQFNTLLKWFQQVPELLLRQHHRLYSRYASLLTSVSRFDEAENALAYLANEVPDDPEIQGEAAFSLSNIARMLGDLGRSIAMGDKALQILPPENKAMLARVNWNTGYALYLDGRFREAKKLLTKACELGEQSGETTAASAAVMVLGNLAVNSGRLHTAEDTMLEAIKKDESTGAYLVLSLIAYERNGLENAIEYARKSNEISELGSVWESQIYTYFIQARSYLALGDEARAAGAMSKMDEASRHPTVSRVSFARTIAMHILFALYDHDLEAASAWGDKLADCRELLALQYGWVPARLLIAQRRKTEAAASLSTLYEKVKQEEAQGLRIEVRVCQALAADETEQAIAYLADALLSGEGEGYIRTFVDESEALKPLLRVALSRAIAPDYTKRLLDIMEKEERQHKLVLRHAGGFGSYSSILSKREREVMLLLADGCSNQEIADKMVVSLSTAKSHVHNILEKLEADNRARAIVRARELSLI